MKFCMKEFGRKNVNATPDSRMYRSLESCRFMAVGWVLVIDTDRRKFHNCDGHRRVLRHRRTYSLLPADLAAAAAEEKAFSTPSRASENVFSFSKSNGTSAMSAPNCVLALT